MSVGPAILAALLGVMTVFAGWAAGRDVARPARIDAGRSSCSCKGKIEDNKR